LHTEIDHLLSEKEYDNQCRSFGKILWLLTNLSFILNINTFQALLKEIQNQKISEMDDLL
jgi:hypothetical protein